MTFVGAVWFVATSQRRRRRRSIALLAIVAGVLGGLATSLLAGASRSSSVVESYSAAQPAVDVRVFGSGLDRDQLLAIPGVARADVSSYVAMNHVRSDGELGDGVNGETYDYRLPPSRGMVVVAGHLPDGSDPTHIAVNEYLLSQLGLELDDALTVRMYRDNQADQLQQEIYEPAGPTYVFHVDAVVRQARDIAVDEVRVVPKPGGTPAHQSRGEMLLPYAFFLAHRTEFLDFGEDFEVRLQHGAAGVDAFTAALTQAAPPDSHPGLEPGGNTRQASFDAPVDLETRALLGVGVGVAVGALILVALLLSFEQRAYEYDVEPLRAVGLVRARLRWVAAARVAPAAALAMIFAATVAILASGQYPIGIGRLLELNGGIAVNVAVVVAGSVLTGVAMVAIAALAAGRRPERSRLPASHMTLARRFSRSGAPLGPSVGAHLAFESHNGRRSAAARRGLGAATALLVLALAAGVWVAGVDATYDNAARHGWPWDVVIGNSNFTLPATDAAALRSDSRFDGTTAASYGQLTIAGESVEALVVDDGGTAVLPVTRGRAPHGADEVALGVLTLRRHHLAIGDSVELALKNSEFGEGGTKKVTIVGETLAPVLGESELGDIAIVPVAAVRATGVDTEPQIVLATFKPGADRDATLASLGNDVHEELTLDIAPARVVNLHRVRGVALFGVVIASVLAGLVLAYSVAAGARRHRRDIAVLQALGLERSGVRRALLWQGALLAVVVLAAGVPLGLAAGAKLWAGVAAGIGINEVATLPVWLTLPAAEIVLATLVATVCVGRWRPRVLVDALRAD